MDVCKPTDALTLTSSKAANGVGDLYSKMKVLQRQLEFLEIQEEYIKDEMSNLKRELVRAKEEVKRIQSVPLVIGQFLEIIDHNHGIVSSTTGSNYYVRPPHAQISLMHSLRRAVAAACPRWPAAWRAQTLSPFPVLPFP